MDDMNTKHKQQESSVGEAITEVGTEVAAIAIDVATDPGVDIISTAVDVVGDAASALVDGISEVFSSFDF